MAHYCHGLRRAMHCAVHGRGQWPQQCAVRPRGFVPGPINICVIYVCVDMCIDMCVGMCIDMFTDMCTEMCMDNVYRHVCEACVSSRS